MRRDVVIRVALAVAVFPAAPAVLDAQSCAYAASATAQQTREEADRDAQLSIEGARRALLDFDKCRQLGAAIPKTRRVATANKLFSAAATLRGEFEIAELLVVSAQRGLLEVGTAPAFFLTARKITADLQMRRVLSAALHAQKESPAIAAHVLRAAPSIAQDYELASLLVEVAAAVPITGDLLAPYLAATRTLQNSAERKRAMEALSATRDTASR